MRLIFNCNVAAVLSGTVTFTCGFVVVDADAVQLQVAVSVIGTSGIDAVLIADHLPELQRQKEGDQTV